MAISVIQGTSKLWEDDGDREAEKAFRKTIEERFNCQTEKLPMEDNIDIICSRGGAACCYGELKVRYHKFNTYPTVILARQKCICGLYFASRIINPKTEKPIPFIFFTRFADGDYWARIKPIYSYRQEKFQAYNHPDVAEWVIHIPLSDFRKF